MRTYLDLDGLTHHPDPVWYADALGLHYDEVVEGEDARLALLARLRQGAGVTILTGPEAAPFWGLASPEVHVRVVPDGYDFRDRYEAEEWSYHAAGCTPREAGELLRRERPPTTRHRLHPKWEEAQRFRSSLRPADALVLVDYDVPVWTVEEVETRLDHQDAPIALDFEWSTGEDTALQPIGLALADAQTTAWCQVWTPDDHDHAGGQRLREAVRRFHLQGGQAIWHDARADLGAQHPGDPLELVPGWRGHDTKVLMYLMGDRQLSLKTGARRYLRRDPVEFGAFGRSLEHVHPAAVARYAGADARNTFDLWLRLMAALGERDQLGIYDEFERRLPPFIASMERFGTPIDVEAAREEMVRCWDEAAHIREAVRCGTGHDLYSDEETRALLAEDFALGFDPGTLDQRVLTRFDSGWVDVVLGFRQNRTLARNFLGAHLVRWEEAGRPAEHRVHARFNQAGPVNNDDRSAPRTGRLSSADPNLQNQPRALRRIFVPPEGARWWSFDYSQLELRVAAALSRDPVMLEAYAHEADLHQELVEEVEAATGMSIERVAAKAGNFAKKYGADWKQIRDVLAKQRVMVGVEVAKAISDAHDSRFRGYTVWAEHEGSRAVSRGYGLTHWGRRGYKPFDPNDLSSLSGAQRFFVNLAIQGTAALVVKKTMLNIAPLLLEYNAHCAIQVHDELDGWAPADVAEEFLERAEAVASEVPLPGVTLSVEGGTGRTWADAH